jgi:3-hydroxyisobutyrate dehydrogenase-like beta-hydroxyacid dehydrogenase
VRVGILHPGEMGAAVGDVLVERGHVVSWASAGRSAATAARASRLVDCGTVDALVRDSDVVLSVCPPHAAQSVAKEVSAAGSDFVFVDANAVSPTTARVVGALGADAGARFVDGGIVGGPPTAAAPGRTRLYLSGTDAPMVADLFAGTPLDTRVLEGGAGAASALKACFAAYTKGTTALLLAIRALADAECVDDALLAEWAISQPDLVDRSAGAPVGSARKAWRFVGEMSEIADAFAAQGLPDGFHRASAEVYERLESFADRTSPPTIEDLLRAVRSDGLPRADS